MPKNFYVSSDSAVTHGNPIDKKNTSKKYFGIYIGIVDFNTDATRTGKVSVYIAELNRDPSERTLFECMYTSPFYGGSSTSLVKSDDVTQEEKSRRSYGFWTPPPDVGNVVLVAFGDGLLSNPFIIGHTMPTPYNQMIPGIPGGPSFQGGPFNTPTVEKNNFDPDDKHNGKLRPIFHDFAETITKQGLINDPIRGATSSSARRESPSQVLGILTKGPRDPDGKPLGPGHQFIMDDSESNSNIRLRTGGGNQILLDDSTGSIYVINKNGTAWFELDKNGNINVFGEGSMSLRSKGDFNLRADKNVNIEAGNDVNIKAAGDNDAGGYKGIASKLGGLGIPPLGVGGSVRIHGTEDVSIHANLNSQITANAGELQLSSAGRLTATSTLGVAVQSQGYTTVQATGKLDVLSGGVATVSAGGVLNLFGATIGLNNPGVPPTPDLIPAIPAPQLGGAEKPDQSSSQPEYDRESEGNPIQNGGQRPEKGPSINTIVGKLVTAEPYIGHGQYDPSSDDKESMEEDISAESETLENQIDPTDETPADADTPEGTKIGKGFSDAKDKFGDLKDDFDEATSGIKSIYEDYNAVLSDFYALQDLNFASIQGLVGIADKLGIAIPPFRIPTVTTIQQKIIGQSKILTDLEARLNQFSLDGLGLPVDLQDTVVKGMKGDISGAINDATGGKVEDFKNAAKDKVNGAIKGATGGSGSGG